MKHVGRKFHNVKFSTRSLYKIATQFNETYEIILKKAEPKNKTIWFPSFKMNETYEIFTLLKQKC